MLTVTLPVLLRDPAGMARTAAEYVQHSPPQRDAWVSNSRPLALIPVVRIKRYHYTKTDRC